MSLRSALARLLAGLGLLAGLAAPPAGAEPPVAPAAPARAEPEPIPAAEVADRAQDEVARLRGIAERAQPDPAVADIEAQLGAAGQEAADLAGRYRERLAGSPSRRELGRAAFEFDRLRERLAGWSAVLGTRAENLDADLAYLDQRRAVWTATRARAAATSQAPAVLARIDATLAGIDRTAKEVRARRNAVLTIRENVAHQQSTVQSQLDLVARKRDQLRESFFELDSPPLWQSMAAEGRSQQRLLERMAAARANDLEDLRVYGGEGRFLAFPALAAVGILVAFAIRRPVRRLAAEDETLVAPAQLLERPFAAGTVGSLLAAPLLVGGAPPVVGGTYGFLLLIASLRLVLPLVDPGLRRLCWGLAIWYALDRLRDRLVPDPFASRLLVLLAACIAVGVLAWLLRPRRIAQLSRLAQLVSESFVNWTLSDRQQRIEIPVGISYGSDPDRVLEILESAVRARPEVLRQPPPTVTFDRLGESSLDFLVRAWAADFDSAASLRSTLIRDILAALRAAGIEIPYPQRELHLRTAEAALRPRSAADPADSPGAREARRGAAPAAGDRAAAPVAPRRPG